MVRFQRAHRESIGLLIGCAGPSGGGKTYTAMELATGMSGGKPFAVIDTEAGRAKHYADRFVFDHADLSAPFRPDTYLEAIEAADKAGYPVIVVDSMSHEHAGDGGLLDWHEEELDRMAGDDWKKRERVKYTAWIKPKAAHKRMVSKMLQVRAHLILCFRAEQKTEMPKKGDKETHPKRLLSGFVDWIPIAEKNLLYELALSIMLLPDAPGCARPVKIPEQFRSFINGGWDRPSAKPIDRSIGEKLAQWASGSPGLLDSSTAGVGSGKVSQAAPPARAGSAPAPALCPECGQDPCSEECSLQGELPEPELDLSLRGAIRRRVERLIETAQPAARKELETRARAALKLGKPIDAIAGAIAAWSPSTPKETE